VDFFVSYTAEDLGWAEWIAWQLEAAGFRVLIQAWDFVPGTHWISGLVDGVGSSDRVVAVLSHTYLESVYGRAEWQAAFRADPDGAARKVIPIRVQDCPRPVLLDAVVSFDLFGLTAEEARTRLDGGIRAALTGRAKPSAEPRFPGGAVAADLYGGGARRAPRFPGSATNPARPSGQPTDEIFAAIRRTYRALADLLGTAEAPAMPTRWALEEIRALRGAVHVGVPMSQADARGCADALVSLCDSALVGPVLQAIGVDELTQERAQCLYRSVVERWPTSGSVRGMVTEAAQVALVERRNLMGLDLDALSRFVLALAADRGLTTVASVLADWIRETGHQVADAEAFLAQRTAREVWLLVDLGDEPLPGRDHPWPRLLTAQLCPKGWERDDAPLPVTEQEICAREEDLVPALRRLLSRLDLPGSGLFVDIAAPRMLLDGGVEHLDVMPVDEDAYEPFTAGYRPRMRWSKRRTSRQSFERLRARTACAVWRNDVVHLAPEHCSDREAVRVWLRRHTSQVLLGSPGPGGFDPLRTMLTDGHGFVVWFPGGVDEQALGDVRAAQSGTPIAARKTALPDALSSSLRCRHVVIWDDPDGREGIRMPAIVRPQNPDS
jgi:hypothetical protein